MSRPYRLRLRVNLDEQLIRQIDPTLPKTLSPNVFIVNQIDQAGKSNRRRLREKDGVYSFRCETPHPAISVIVNVANLGEEVWTFIPDPSKTDELSVSYPR